MAPSRRGPPVNQGPVTLKLVDADITPAPGAPPVLRGVSLEARPGDYICIAGPNGSGKTSLAKTLALITKPARGQLLLNNWNATQATEAERARARLHLIGYIPQQDTLIPQLTILENITLPLKAMGTPKHKAEQAAREWAEKLGISHLLDRKPPELSGGQRRLALATRALVKNPQIIIADEPEAGLDESRLGILLQVLEAQAESGKIVIHLTPTATEIPRRNGLINLKSLPELQKIEGTGLRDQNSFGGRRQPGSLRGASILNDDREA